MVVVVVLYGQWQSLVEDQVCSYSETVSTIGSAVKVVVDVVDVTTSV
jgi:hypothetical protein